LPEDLAISFYIQCHKLIFAAYQLTNIQGTMEFNSCQAECSVPWLNEVLVLFTVGLQLCQQLKDKVSGPMFYVELLKSEDEDYVILVEDAVY
jgi:protein rogdi